MTVLSKVRRFIGSPGFLLTGLPILVSLPEFLGILKADPVYRAAKIALYAKGAIIGGNSLPIFDGNDGWTTQALGRLAASDWVHLIVPWWNPYSGAGLPLAGEYQSAAFSPFVLLQLLPQGMTIQHCLLQIIAGWGTYKLLRRLNLSTVPATVGGALFAFNGTLVLVNHGPALPIPWLPWALLGIECIRTRSSGGWPLLALALALSIAAGFPETAYIDGLLVLAWTVLRFVQASPHQRLGFAGRIVLAGIVALAINAPQLVSFIDYLRVSDVGVLHAGRFADLHFFSAAALVSLLIAPFAYGPMHQFGSAWSAYPYVISPGYVTLTMVAAAVIGLGRRSEGIGPLLLAWILLALAKTFAIQPLTAAWNMIPGMKAVAFFYYGQPSWEFSFAVLAALGLDNLTHAEPASRRKWLIAAGSAAALMLASGVAIGVAARAPILIPGLNLWFSLSMLVAGLFAFGFLLFIGRSMPGGAASALLGEAVIVAIIPMLSDPVHAKIDRPAIDFLKSNLGFFRFYTLEPLQANYGAYFRIASINFNYLPIASGWLAWVRQNLDSQVDSVNFGGFEPGPTKPSAVEELSRNLENYERAGVKYVLTPFWYDQRLGFPGTLVYKDSLLSIWALADPRPYFDVVQGHCPAATTVSRRVIILRCTTAATVVRREMFLDGWSANSGNHSYTVRRYDGIFQSVSVGPGDITLKFSYSPPFIMGAWLAMGAGFALLIIGFWSDCRLLGRSA